MYGKKYLLKHPFSLLKSIYYSKRYSTGFKKILCTSKTKIVNAKNAEICIGKGAIIGHINSGIGRVGTHNKLPISIQAEENASIKIGEWADIYGGVQILADKNATIEIGTNTLISLQTKIFAKEKITIGSNCLISWNVQILDSDHHTIVIDGEQREKNAEVKIGNKVWISTNVTILKGVTIGDNCVIAANSVVTKSFPPGVLIAGNPARILKEKVDFIP